MKINFSRCRLRPLEKPRRNRDGKQSYTTARDCRRCKRMIPTNKTKSLPGCCAASQVAILAALKQRYASELNPDVRRGIMIAIVAIKGAK